jgi:hypothetical protein
MMRNDDQETKRVSAGVGKDQGCSPRTSRQTRSPKPCAETKQCKRLYTQCAHEGWTAESKLAVLVVAEMVITELGWQAIDDFLRA